MHQRGLMGDGHDGQFVFQAAQRLADRRFGGRDICAGCVRLSARTAEILAIS